MKVKLTALIILIASIMAFAYHFNAIAYIDAPHNPSSHIYCDSCHGYEIFWVGTGSYDALCESCHKRPFCLYTDDDAPSVWTHLDSDDNKLAECRTCHNPHEHKQKLYKNTEADNLYLARGEITNYGDNGDGTSTLNYSSITYKDGWDATKLTGKTETCRRTILFPNTNKLGYSYPVIGVDEGAKTITVKGNASPVYQYISPPSSFAVMYGQYIKDTLNNLPVKFFDQTGKNSFADGDTIYNGVCEVCHTLTEHYRNDGEAPDQNHSNVGGADGTNCISCHSHVAGFIHGEGAVGGECIKCHGHDAGYEYSPEQYSQGEGTFESHSTHTENDSDDLKGPYMNCDECHDTNNYPKFSDGNNLSATNVCDSCHSPNGSFNGVDSVGNSIGAKDYWKDAIYPDLASEEKWCAGCHDDEPSVVDSNTAPDIVGNNATYGYYLGAHGNDTEGVNHQSVSNVQGACVHCHEVSIGETPLSRPATRIIDESFEGPNQETWIYTITDGCNLDPDSSIPGTPPVGAGSQCLKSVSDATGYQAYASLVYDSEEAKTFTRMYLYVESEELSNGDNKTIGALRDSSNNNVFIFRLNQDSDDLRFNLRLYNNGVCCEDYYAIISTETWYRIEVKYNNKDGDPDNDTWEWRLFSPDGTLLKQNNGDLQGTHYLGIKKWHFGFIGGAQDEEGTVYFDQISVDTNDWIGENPSALSTPHGGWLFATTFINQETGFCFKCHTDPTESLQISMPYQYSYSYIRGSNANLNLPCPDDIKEAFAFIDITAAPQSNCNSSLGSSHFLINVQEFLRNKWGWGDEVKDIDPCKGCHNPHRAKKDWPCSLPSGHADTSTWEVWGDDSNEKMANGGFPDIEDQYPLFYQPPLKKEGSIQNEWIDENDAPNYVNLCYTCHYFEVYSTRYAGNLRSVGYYWYNFSGGSPRNPHGAKNGAGSLKEPYTTCDTKNCILMCTDCHEPHGSANENLLRTCVNGVDDLVINRTSASDMRSWCRACHILDEGHMAGELCWGCHYTELQGHY